MRQVPEHFYRQSAVLPYRRGQEGLEILLVSSRRKKRWVIPKGVHEPHLDAAASAAKEALEEAGIEGEVSRKALGSYRYEKWDGICTVEVFTMVVHIVHEEWEESYRDREWFLPTEAASKVTEPELEKMILDFAATVTV